MKEREALKLALEALTARWMAGDLACVEGAITAIKEALAQPEQEPVAWRYGALLYWDKLDALEFMRTSNDGYQLEPLYTTPPQRTWVGLTDGDIQEIISTSVTMGEFIKNTEAKLKEKNT